MVFIALENFSTWFLLAFDLYQGHMIKSKFFLVHPLVIPAKPKLHTVGGCYLKYMLVLSKSQAD